MVQSWALRFSNVGVIIVGSGPPCQGVSGLNAERRGALRDARNCLSPSGHPAVQISFPLGTGSISDGECCLHGRSGLRRHAEFKDEPWYIDACGVGLSRRPWLYWVSWELMEGEGAAIGWGSEGPSKGRGLFHCKVSWTLPNIWKQDGNRKASLSLPSLHHGRALHTIDALLD